MSDAAIMPPAGDARRWTASLLIVLAAHAAGGAALLSWRVSHAPEAAENAVMIDLAPLPEPTPPPPPEPTPSEPPPPEPPPPEPPPEPEVLPEPIPELTPPPPVPVPEPAVSIPPPRTKPKPPERQQPVAKPIEPRPPAPAPPANPAPAPVAAPPSPAPPVSAGAVRSWQGAVLAHLERHKRYPRAAQSRGQQGVVHVRFVIDERGHVLSRSLEKSSGVSALDEETLALLNRADPLPAPPADMARGRVELVVPVMYAIR